MNTYRIAYITYEYPPDIHAGGIATYVYEVSRMMVESGWEVEIFAGSFEREGLFIEDNIKVNRIKIKDQFDFREKVVERFIERNNLLPFQLFETPEINANALEIVNKFHEIPFITRLHTPVSLQMKLLNWHAPFIEKIRYVLGSIKKGKIDLGFWRKSDSNRFNDLDYKITIKANKISSPSDAMKQWAVNYWKIPAESISVLPNVYTAPKELLEQEYNPNRKYLTFIGKLNVHKGMVELTKAIPIILAANPELSFCFIGADGKGPNEWLSMKNYMLSKLSKWSNRLVFTGPLQSREIYNFLNISKACIFPSIWEAFGYVVLEAMSAGVPVIVANNSGMAEIVKTDEFGVLVDPLNWKDISFKTCKLLSNESSLINYSVKGRKRAFNYSKNSCANLYITLYKQVIEAAID